MTAGNLSRRQFLKRFLAISAVSLLPGPAAAQKITRWRGQALGTETEITLRGPKDQATAALRAAKASLRRMEKLFSLYDPGSDLVRLNEEGRLERPAPEFVNVLRLSDEIHHATGGVFDPSIQPLWQALAHGNGQADTPAFTEVLPRVGWTHVGFDSQAVWFEREGMALTFNGIAQGFATDRVAADLRAFGFADTLVNVGEFRAGDGSWRIGISDPAVGLVATRKLERAAIATSSPSALRFTTSGPGHILHPSGTGRRPLWSTVSVEAARAAVADGYSTAFTFLDKPAIAEILQHTPDLHRVLLVTEDGETLELA